MSRLRRDNLNRSRRTDLVLNCTDWKSTVGFSDGDTSCFGGPGNVSGDPLDSNRSLPGALIRGGNSGDREAAGVFAVGPAIPSLSMPIVGFRCAR